MKARTVSPKTMLALSVCLLFVAGWALSAPKASYAAMPVVVGGKALVTNTDGDNIRIRKGAGAEHDSVGQAREGETVTVLAGPAADKAGKKWYKVQGANITGWMAAEFLDGRGAGPASPKEVVARPAAKIDGFARVANTDGDTLRVRSIPDAEGKILSSLAPNTSVAIKAGPITDIKGIVWYQVLAHGVTGWVMGQYLVQAQAATPLVATEPKAGAKAKPEAKPVAEKPGPVAKKAQPTAKPQPTPEAAGNDASRNEPVPDTEEAVMSRGQRVASIGLGYAGSRYVYGATGPNAFDCSGFIYYVYNKAGVRMPRDMRSQLASGQRISVQELMPGDLLFWSNTYKPGLSHAGIYVGNGKFVHAENEGTGVIVSSMSNPYYASRFTAAVRPR